MSDAPEQRPTVVVREELVAVTDDALTALMAWPAHGIYRRGDRLLVRVLREHDRRHAWLRRSLGAPVIVPLEVDGMLDRLDRAARWVKPAGKQLIAARPPEWVARQVMARLDLPFPRLEGITETPTLSPDGTVLQTPGYDAPSGLLYVASRGVAYPAVPDLSLSDVPSLLEILFDPVSDFPFVGESDRAAYLGAVLSVIGRYAIPGPVPAFSIRSPVPAAGKGLLARVIAWIATGREPAIMTHPGDDTEMRKRILTLGIEGTPLIVLDNLSGTLGSDQLAAALTAVEWSDRLLGVSQLVKVPLNGVWLLTGVNMRFAQTLGRRIIPLDLDPQSEHPEDRRDSRYPNLIERVRMQRPALVLAALALLRAYVIAGQPAHGASKMGSYEGWDDLVRGTLVWAGLSDPAANSDPRHARGRIRADADEDLEALDILLTALAATFGSTEFTVSDALGRALSGMDAGLKAALDLTGTDRRGVVTAHSLGLKFRDVQARVLRGRKLVRVPTRHGHPFKGWRVDGGDGGL